MAIVDEVSNKLVTEIVRDRGAPSKVCERLRDVATSQLVVVSVEFRVGLLKNEYPQLVLLITRKNWLALRIARKVVIDGDGLPGAVLAKPHAVNSKFVDFARDEKSLNKRGPLCQHRQTLEEPFVAEDAGLHVGWLHLVSKD